MLLIIAYAAESILRTNFFRRDIVALAFRLEPSFLAKLYADTPFGLYLVVGAEFRGFHVRFADVARGGVRLIKSASAAAYTSNLNGLFEECYSLANTQVSVVVETGRLSYVFTICLRFQRFCLSFVTPISPTPMCAATQEQGHPRERLQGHHPAVTGASGQGEGGLPEVRGRPAGPHDGARAQRRGGLHGRPQGDPVPCECAVG